jgi:hypothetical protein
LTGKKSLGAAVSEIQEAVQQTPSPGVTNIRCSSKVRAG